MPAPRKYPDELRHRAVRLVRDRVADEPALPVSRACRLVGEQLGINGDTLRNWVRSERVDDGEVAGRTSSDAARMAELEKTGTTSGIDLAADPKRTALASIAWHHGSAQLTNLVAGVPDHLALHYLHEPGAKVAIDSPLGWPVDFVDFVKAHSEHRLLELDLDLGSPMDSGGNPAQKSTWRRSLANRTTDMYVRQSMPLVPLSVSTDRIAHVAMRAARLMAHCSRDMRRDGAGDIVEVYPAASLCLWGLPYRGYKGVAHQRVRASMVDDLLRQMPWLEVSDGNRLKLSESDDLLDAFVSALTARAVMLGATQWPSDECTADRAQREGWIHLPTVGPARLVG